MCLGKKLNMQYSNVSLNSRRYRLPPLYFRLICCVANSIM
uniref:Uncharacterized protein n=1 Tax=Anguilla anguilla TaxID=7936 RepID=A0A0E9VAS0_ANGAN